MSVSRRLAIALSLLLAAGCSSGTASVAPTPPTALQPASAAPRYPATSSAAQHILGGMDASRAAQNRDDGREDDGDFHDLQLPALQSCGNGILATDCSVWSFTGGRVIRSVRATASLTLASPPVLNFCRDSFPVGDLGAPALPMLGLGTSAFSLYYSGTKPTPIVSFATRWSDVTLANTFNGTATTAKAITLTPVTGNSAYRGWLLFFTWSWPADILAIPFAVNEIQLAASSSPLAIPAGGSAPLGAFDCLGRPIAATASGSGYGFNAGATGSQLTSASAELNAPVYGGASSSGTVYLSDDRGARTSDPVTTRAATPPPVTGTPPPGR